jgi:hypothetical protein
MQQRSCEYFGRAKNEPLANLGVSDESFST